MTDLADMIADNLVRDLGWVGLQMMNLLPWASDSLTRAHQASKVDKDYCTSEKWLFLGMEL